MVKVREGCSWLLCYLGVFSLDTSGFGQGRAEGLGSAPLPLWFSTLEGRQAMLAVGRTCPSAEFCLLLRAKLCLWEWPLYWDLINTYLTIKGPHHLLGSLRGNPGTLSPFPYKGASRGCVQWLPLPSPLASLPLPWVFTTGDTLLQLWSF